MIVIKTRDSLTPSMHQQMTYRPSSTQFFVDKTGTPNQNMDKRLSSNTFKNEHPSPQAIQRVVSTKAFNNLEKENYASSNPETRRDTLSTHMFQPP